MSARDPIPALPQELRFELNMKLGDRELAALDNNARYIVRRLVGDAYVKGFDAGWLAGMHDTKTDQEIIRDAEKP